jgi:hypothetical protein
LKKPLTDVFPHYSGKLELEPMMTFVKAEFLNRNRDANKTIYPHFTCGTLSNTSHNDVYVYVYVCVCCQQTNPITTAADTQPEQQPTRK